MNRNKILLATLCLLTITPGIKQFEATATQIQMTQQEADEAEKKITQAVKEAIEEFKQQPIIEIKDITTGLTIGKFYKLCSDEEVQYVEQTDKTQKKPANIKCEISKQQLESANIKAKIIEQNAQIQVNYRTDANKSYCKAAQTTQDNCSEQYANRITDELRKAMLDQFEYQRKVSPCQKLIKFIEESVIKSINNNQISNKANYKDFAARIMALEIKKIAPGSLRSEFQDKIERITDILANYSIIPLEQAILLESIGIEAKDIVPKKYRNKKDGGELKVPDQLQQEYFEKLKAVSQPVTVATTQLEKENKQKEFQESREKLLKNIKEVVLDKINGKLYDFLEKIKQLKIPQIDKAISINLFTIDDKDVTIIKEGDSLVSIVLPNVSLAYFPMEDKFMNMKKLMAIALASAVMYTGPDAAGPANITNDTLAEVQKQDPDIKSGLELANTWKVKADEIKGIQLDVADYSGAQAKDTTPRTNPVKALIEKLGEDMAMVLEGSADDKHAYFSTAMGHYLAGTKTTGAALAQALKQIKTHNAVKTTDNNPGAAADLSDALKAILDFINKVKDGTQKGTAGILLAQVLSEGNETQYVNSKTGIVTSGSELFGMIEKDLNDLIGKFSAQATVTVLADTIRKETEKEISTINDAPKGLADAFKAAQVYQDKKGVKNGEEAKELQTLVTDKMKVYKDINAIFGSAPQLKKIFEDFYAIPGLQAVIVDAIKQGNPKQGLSNLLTQIQDKIPAPIKPKDYKKEIEPINKAFGITEDLEGLLQYLGTFDSKSWLIQTYEDGSTEFKTQVRQALKLTEEAEVKTKIDTEIQKATNKAQQSSAQRIADLQAELQQAQQKITELEGKVKSGKFIPDNIPDSKISSPVAKSTESKVLNEIDKIFTAHGVNSELTTEQWQVLLDGAKLRNLDGGEIVGVRTGQTVQKKTLNEALTPPTQK